MTDTPANPRPGIRVGDTVAGRYRLTRLVATGGMASVWEATDLVLERKVAVKVLHPHLAADERFVARFRSEAVAVARIHHPNIVSVYDTCSDGEVEAIVMELVVGQNYRSYLDQHGPLIPAEATHISAEAADALAAAHTAGLVHRDIKPANILIREDGQVLVTDFGIAKLRGEQSELTSTGTMLGSVKYLAPEQVEDSPVDARTDVYALGIVTYEALTGQVPFTAETDAATALARLRDDPTLPRHLRPGIPRDLESAVMRALARDPARRYATAVEFRAALLAAPTVADPTVAHRAGPAAPRPAPKTAVPTGPVPTFAESERRWLIPTLLIVLLALALAVAGVLIGRTDAGQDLFNRARDAVAPAEIGQEASSSTPVITTGDLTATDYDPEGGDGEHPERAVLAVDGDVTTAWTTESYSQRDMGAKRGVGLVVELPQRATVESVEVESGTNDWSGAIYIADAVSPDLDGWGAPVAQASNIAGAHDFQVGGVDGSVILLWITDVGDGSPRARTEINEMVIAVS